MGMGIGLGMGIGMGMCLGHVPADLDGARQVGDSVRLYSVDHADLFITNERNAMTTELLAGIPHSLLLSNSNGELAVLVPSVPPVRPAIGAVPFSTELVLDRSDRRWLGVLENAFYIYPVHVSLSFLYSTTLASALYLLLLRYLGRQVTQPPTQPDPQPQL